MVFLICLETVPLRKIPKFEGVLLNNCNDVQPLMRETWLINSPDKKVKEWSELLMPLLNKQDSLLVIEITKVCSGFLPKQIWNWLNRAFGAKS